MHTHAKTQPPPPQWPEMCTQQRNNFYITDGDMILFCFYHLWSYFIISPTLALHCCTTGLPVSASACQAVQAWGTRGDHQSHWTYQRQWCCYSQLWNSTSCGDVSCTAGQWQGTWSPFLHTESWSSHHGCPETAGPLDRRPKVSDLPQPAYWTFVCGGKKIIFILTELSILKVISDHLKLGTIWLLC